MLEGTTGRSILDPRPFRTTVSKLKLLFSHSPAHGHYLANRMSDLTLLTRQNCAKSVGIRVD